MIDKKRLKELEDRNKIIANMLSRDDLEFEEVMELKEELYKNKLDMISILKDKEEIKFSTLQEASQKLQNMPKKQKYETGIVPIDKHFDGGLETSQLVLIGGEKGAGKTAFSLQYLLNVSQGFKSAFYSFEMPEWKMAQRLLKKNPTKEQTQNFFIVDQGRDIAQIEVSIKTLVKDHGVKFIAIDSLMKITNSFIKDSQHQKLSDITNRLSRLAVELDIVIVLIVQIAKDDLKSGYMAVKGSGDADYDADVMFFLKRDKDDPVKRYFICSKNRQNGREFKEEVYFNPKSVSLQEYKPNFTEIAYVIQEDEKIEMSVL